METNPNVKAAKHIDTHDNMKNDETKQKGSFVQRMLNAIHEAKDVGADPSQIRQMRQMLLQQTNWHPTKKRLSKATRSTKRRQSRKSRQINQRRQRAHNYTKGHRKSGRV